MAEQLWTCMDIHRGPLYWVEWTWNTPTTHTSHISISVGARKYITSLDLQTRHVKMSQLHKNVLTLLVDWALWSMCCKYIETHRVTHAPPTVWNVLICSALTMFRSQIDFFFTTIKVSCNHFQPLASTIKQSCLAQNLSSRIDFISHLMYNFLSSEAYRDSHAWIRS